MNTTINESDYDIIIHTDGSGTIINSACGYVAVIRHLTHDDLVGKAIDYIIGTDNHGTNNYAELFAIVKALYFLKASYCTIYKNPSILIVTDSEWVVKTALGEYEIDWQKALSLFWDIFSVVEDSWGYKLHFRHVPRNSVNFNAFCDKWAGQARKNMVEFNRQAETEIKTL